MYNSVNISLEKRIIIVILVVFGIGFYTGMKYKTKQISKKLDEITAGITGSLNSDSDASIKEKQMTFSDEIKKNKEVVIEKNVDELVNLATMNIIVTDSEEKDIVNVPYGAPEIADSGAKFVIVSLSVTNTTSAPFDFGSDNYLLDQQERRFQSKSTSSIEENIVYESLSPSISKQGKLLFLVPEDATSYGLIYRKGGTNEVYKIKIK